MIVLLEIWTAVNVAALCILLMLLIADEGVSLSFVNPMVIYDNIRVNWFGAWLLAIVINVLLPLVSITYWIYKICTVGR